MNSVGFVWLISMLIGAVIGGITNYIAILMLFRPYETKKILGLKVPFTPGIIPKRQKEIAQQLGRVVETHLVTKEAIEEHLRTKSVQKELSDWLERMLLQQLEVIKEAEIGEWFQRLGVYKEELAIAGTNELMHKIKKFVQSAEGERILLYLIEICLKKPRLLGGMIDILLPKDKIMSKLQQWLGEWIEQEELRNWIYDHILLELQQIEGKKVQELLPKRFEEKLLEHTPLLVERVILKLNEDIERWIANMELASIVEKQILSYPLAQLEQLVRELAKRELQMITLFGAVLGGMLGGIQAFLIMFMR